MDGHIGRLVAALKEQSQYDNTIFVFSSDHGLAMGSHGLMGKQNLYDAGMKAPLFMTGPGVPTGESPALAYLVDIYPTVCDLVGAKIPDGLDGQSLKPVIDGKAKGIRDSLFLAYREVQRAVRDERYKLIRYPQVDVTQLFDLQEDPDEIRNLADRPEQAERVRALMERMKKWQEHYGDRAPLKVAEPQSPAWDPKQAPPPAARGKGKGKGKQQG
jgi:arylsulfatase A-like enzyme